MQQLYITRQKKLTFFFFKVLLQCEKKKRLGHWKRRVIQPCIFPAGKISDGKGQCAGSLCGSQEQSFRRCTCSWKTPKLLLWNPLGSYIKSPVNKHSVITLENMGLPMMTPGWSEEGAAAAAAETYSRQLQTREWSWRGKKCPSPSKTCVDLSPPLSLGTDLRNKCHSTS